LARGISPYKIKPQFDEPYLSTSLQDFWGERWNLIVPSLLRPIVYYPIRTASTNILGKRFGLILGVGMTFVVSGLMHEFFWYYFMGVKPTWEVTMFFVLHNFCLALEIIVKKVVESRWRLHPAISRVLTIGFMMITGSRLFFPQIIRYCVDERMIQECDHLFRFVRDNDLPCFRT
ncbi:hypothetical protein GIB67_042861, partial [Kingdonia uniflora]